MPEAITRLNIYRFDQMARLINERVDDPAESGVERYVGLEHLDGDSLRIRRWGEITDVESTKLRFRPGDIIFGKRRVYQRKLAVADFEGICSAHAMVLRAKPNVVLPEFLPFFMQSDRFMQRALEISVGSLSPTINWKTLAAEEFALPAIEEQRRLAIKFSALQASTERLHELRSSIASVRTSALTDFFRPRLSSGQPLRSVASVRAGGTPSRTRKELWGGMRPWASGKDMKVRELAATEERLSDAGWGAAKIAPAGATLVVVRGMILAHTFPVARCLVPMAFNQDLRALIPGEDVLSEYLTLWAEWAGPWFLSRAAESSHGTKRIEGSVIESAVVPIVPKHVQQELIRTQQIILNGIAACRKRLNEAKILKAAIVEAALRPSDDIQ
jgi:type I restriction enzyme, S subunit